MNADFGEQDRPFAIGSVYGVRGFLAYQGDLISPAYFHRWRIGEEMIAYCGATPEGSERAGVFLGNSLWLTMPPKQHHRNYTGSRYCGCGFYAYWNNVDAHRHSSSWYEETPYVGVMQGYGLVTFGEFGFRSAKARLVALADNRNRFHALFRLKEESYRECGCIGCAQEADVFKRKVDFVEATSLVLPEGFPFYSSPEEMIAAQAHRLTNYQDVAGIA